MKSADSVGNPEASRTILTTIRTSATAAEAVKAKSEYLTQELSRFLVLDLGVFELETKAIADCGLDSMIDTELRNWIFKKLDPAVPIPGFARARVDNQEVCHRHLCQRGPGFGGIILERKAI